MRLTVTAGKPVYGGYMLAREEGVVLVRGALPGERVEVEVVRKKRDYAIAKVVLVHDPSPHRLAAPCPVYGECGGCQIQHAEYSFQLVMKREILRDVLRRGGKLSIDPGAARGSMPFGYRHRGQFKASLGKVGFYRENSRDLVSVDRCPLMIESVNAAFDSCRIVSDVPAVREIHVASDGRESIVAFPGLRRDERIVSLLEGKGIAGLVFDDAVHGAVEIELNLSGMRYVVSGRTFFQANWEMNLRLVERVRELVRESGGERMLDLYAGAGNFALPLSPLVREVVAVEGNPAAVRDLRANIEQNGIGNCRVAALPVERYRPNGRFDVVLLDPPRTGLTNKALDLILDLSPRLLLYVSCDPPTLARDLRKLSARFAVRSVEPFDFFPNTHHVETLSVLASRNAVGRRPR